MNYVWFKCTQCYTKESFVASLHYFYCTLYFIFTRRYDSYRMRPNASFWTLKKTFWENFEANSRIYENLIFKGIIMVIVSTILYVDMLRFANTFSAQLNDFIILVINWIFCIFVFIINLAIAIYGFVCGCCYSKEFEKIIQNEQPKSAFSFTTSNKVFFHLVISEKS